MDHSIPTQLRFPANAGFTVRAEFDGGAMSSDFGAVLLRGINLQIGLIPRLVSAIDDKRHASYIDHPLADLLRQRIFQTASGYADGNNANTLRRDPLFNLAVGRANSSTLCQSVNSTTVDGSVGPLVINMIRRIITRSV